MALTPSQRITLIREISARLGAEEYPLIDVTLKQFSLPWSMEWGGSKEGYVMQMIEEAPDLVLSELARHVGYHVELDQPQRVDPPFWRKGMFRVFISHLAVNREYAAELQTAFLDYGISSFVAHNDIEPTLEWQAQIETALSTCDALIALLHPGFHESNWTDQEIGFAMGRGVPTFAVRYGHDPYGFIGRFQAFNGNGKAPPVLAKEIFEAYRKNKQTQGRMIEVLVGKFEDSGSFIEARENIALLEALDMWEPVYSDRINSAVKNNSQISGSWGTPARVDRLIKKWAAGG